eukprot:1321484-Pleurochrysis_carterae.AAC.1
MATGSGEAPGAAAGGVHARLLAAARSSRAISEARVTARAAELQLTGALGTRADDAWARGQQPTAEQRERVEELRRAYRARVHEANDNRHLATVLEWWADFTQETGREPFLDPTELGGHAYNEST